MTEPTEPTRRRRRITRRTAMIKGRISPEIRTAILAYAAAHNISQATALDDILGAGLHWLVGDQAQPDAVREALAEYKAADL